MTDLQRLAADFWAWRAGTRPSNPDDLPRMDRPEGWLPDWSAAAVADTRKSAAAFADQLAAIDVSAEPVSVRVDARLLRTAIDRAHWELDLVRGWQHHPGFYVDQAILPIFELMLPPPPFDSRRAGQIVAQLANAGTLFEQARENLTGHAAGPYARLTIDLLARMGPSLTAAMAALAPELPTVHHGPLREATASAVRALDSYRDWLAAQEPAFTGPVAVGPEALDFFLHRIALVPWTAGQLSALARTEWQRSVATEAIYAARCRNVPHPALIGSVEEQVDLEREQEQRMRDFYVQGGILSQPDTLRRYLFAPMPAYLAPLSWFGLTNDMTSVRRADEDAVRYIDPPSDDLPYFERAKAYDPLSGGIVHEGVHAQQLALSWKHPNPIRRYYYDSLPSEGIAFYHEELVLLSGLFDGDPHRCRLIANFMRLRALRADLDIALARGDLDLDKATDRLARTVPVDAHTAWHDATGLAATPGQRLSYQVGKQQILDLLADATLRFGADFDLRRFHDRLWLEGNVPLALQRWELLGDASQLEAADRLAAGRETTEGR